jgi:hypothetical protein
MSFFGPDLRNAVAVGLGSIATLFSGRANEQTQNNLLCENSDNLVQEDGGLILLE